MAGDDCVHELLPCSASITGNIFLVLVYGTILAVGSKSIADGSELLMEILDPGIIGGFILPVLGALPDAAIVAVSALGGSVKEAQKKLSVGIGTLAGANVLLLTVPWIIGVVIGRCDIKNGIAQDGQCHGYNIFKQGVTVYGSVRRTAVVMFFTILPYLIIELVYVVLKIMGKPLSDERWFALGALVVAALLFVGYSVWQFFDMKMQKRRLHAARRRRMFNRFMMELGTKIETEQEQLKKLAKLKAEETAGDVTASDMMKEAGVQITFRPQRLRKGAKMGGGQAGQPPAPPGGSGRDPGRPPPTGAATKR